MTTTDQTSRPRRIVQAYADTNGVPPTEATQTACPAWCDQPEPEHENLDVGTSNEYRMHTRPLDQWDPDHLDADEPIRVYVQGARYADGNSWDEVLADGSVHPGFMGGVGLDAADARRLGEALIRGADLLDGRVGRTDPA